MPFKTTGKDIQNKMRKNQNKSFIKSVSKTFII